MGFAVGRSIRLNNGYMSTNIARRLPQNCVGYKSIREMIIYGLLQNTALLPHTGRSFHFTWDLPVLMTPDYLS
jgi:hypothetical protein